MATKKQNKKPKSKAEEIDLKYDDNGNLKNPFMKGSICYALFGEDFTDLTVKQIAEVFDTSEEVIRICATRVKKAGKKEVYRPLRPRKKTGAENGENE